MRVNQTREVYKSKILSNTTQKRLREVILSNYQDMTIFEVGEQYQNNEKFDSMFMLNPIFDIRLRNNKWTILKNCGFVSNISSLIKRFDNSDATVWEKCRLIQTQFNLPDTFPIMIQLAYSAAKYVEKIPNLKFGKYSDDIVIRVYNDIILLKNGKVTGLSLSKKGNFSKLSAQIKNEIDLSRDAIVETKRADYKYDLSDTSEKESYVNAVIGIKNQILLGNIYQAELTRTMCSDSLKKPQDIYRSLININSSPYLCYSYAGNRSVISSSPELMFSLHSGVISMQPIAGTAAVKENINEDNLKDSNKDNAEHLMLVDLVRNDLSKISKTGYLSVPELMVIKRFGSLEHIVSTIKTVIGTKENDIWDIIPAVFPAGTMTGAPKLRAMEIISDLETSSRDYFSGCIGYTFGKKDAEMSILIRSIFGEDGEYILKAASGIVADSDPESEWKETGNKIHAFAEALF